MQTKGMRFRQNLGYERSDTEARAADEGGAWKVQPESRESDQES